MTRNKLMACRYKEETQYEPNLDNCKLPKRSSEAEVLNRETSMHAERNLMMMHDLKNHLLSRFLQCVRSRRSNREVDKILL